MQMSLASLMDLVSLLLDKAKATPEAKQNLFGPDISVEFKNEFETPNDKPPTVVYLYLPDGVVWSKRKDQGWRKEQ